MQNIQLAKSELIKQNEFYKNPLIVVDFLCKENKINKSFYTEILSWENRITESQPPQFAQNMCGKILTAKNYIKKITYDYLTNNRLFIESYKPHLQRHFVNFLLQKKISIINEKTYDRYEFVESDTQLLDYIFCLYEKLEHKLKNKKITVSYYFPAKTIAYYTIATEAANYLKKPLAFPLVELPLTKDLINIYKKILINPFVSQFINIKSFGVKSEEKLYCNHLVPECVLTDVYLNNLHTIYFSSIP